MIPKTCFTLALIGTVVGACHSVPRTEKANFAATKDEVTVHHSTVGIAFKTVAARVGEPLPSPPITARVTTVESLTEPVFSPLHGRIGEVRVRIGDQVKKGARLVLVQTPELPELTRQRQEAKLAVSLKQATVDRLQQLVSARAVPEHDLAVAQTELDTAKVDVNSAEAKLRSLAVQLTGDGAYWILAERDGTVVELRVSPGASVGPDAEHPVCVVSDLSQVMVIGDVPQAFANGLVPQSPANIRIPGQSGSKIQGTLQMVSGVVDPERQSVPVRVIVDNRDKVLRPNAFVELELNPKATGRTILIPTAAVVTDGLDTAVFIKMGAGKYRKRQITVGRQNTEFTEIASGVEPGDEVVTQNPLLLLNALDDS